MQQGHPRGELIAVQHALAATPEDRRLRDSEQRLLADRRVAPDVDGLTWRSGFVRTARIDDPAALARLLQHPAARFLRELTVEPASRATIQRIWDGPTPPLRVLRLEGGRPADELDVDLCRKLSRLVELVVRGPTLHLTWLPASLQSVTLLMTVVPAETLAALARDALPELRTLSLQTMHEDASGVARILAREDLPALRELAYSGYDERTLCEALVASPLAAQLRTVNLNTPTLDARATTALVDARARFASLESLTVFRGGIRPSDLARLREAYGDRLRC